MYANLMLMMLAAVQRRRMATRYARLGDLCLDKRRVHARRQEPREKVRHNARHFSFLRAFSPVTCVHVMLVVGRNVIPRRDFCRTLRGASDVDECMCAYAYVCVQSVSTCTQHIIPIMIYRWRLATSRRNVIGGRQVQGERRPAHARAPLPAQPLPAEGSEVDDYNDGFVEAVHMVGSKFFKTRRTRTKRLSDSTLRLMELNRQISKSLKRDVRRFNTTSIEEAIERNRGSKVFTRDLSVGQSQLMKLKTDDGRIVSSKPELLEEVERVITNRLTRRLDDFQPPEQAGFRKGYSTVDHIHALRQVIQKTEEYNLPLCLAFVDYEKAFDSIETWAVLQALQRCQVDYRYIEVLSDQSTKPPLQRGVRQGDVISPKLFTAALEDAFKVLDWKGRGININGEYFTHLRFADDIVVMAETMEDLGAMLADLSRVFDRVGLKMNMDKTKVMSNVHVVPTPVIVGDSALEVVDDYVYLGQTVQLGRSNFEKEITRRIRLGWAAFGKLRSVFSSKLPQCLKSKVFDQCVLPVMTYGSETWALTMGLMRKLKVTQRAMERAMLGVSLRIE
ncbi:hypothetical protein MSG28_010984 [Choristoneura fumiferana]|uniref:Uncharacterized protein n=1 Tax=Choristoneura fumiferana TaxID=7141 RepID=A0ACC0KQE7_CHOFU|nr:hypothetical protein MSG28_010984 [Choristoneura fumiferana]